MAHRDGAAVPVHAGIVVGNAKVVQETQDLHGKGFIDLEKSDVPNAESGVLQCLFGGRHGSDAHDLRLDTGVGVADQPHPDRQAQFSGGLRGGEDGGRGAVVQAGGVACRHAAVRAEGSPQGSQVLKRGARPGWLVNAVQRPALAWLEGGDRNQVRLDLVVGVGGREFVL